MKHCGYRTIRVGKLEILISRGLTGYAWAIHWLATILVCFGVGGPMLGLWQ